MSEISIEIPNTVRRAVGFELTATALETLGDDWAVFAQQYRGFSEQIKEQSLSEGMSEELWEETRQALLDERENSSSNWLQIDFFLQFRVIRILLLVVVMLLVESLLILLIQKHIINL